MTERTNSLDSRFSSLLKILATSLCILMLVPSLASAATETRAIATTAGDIEIPIVVLSPDVGMDAETDQGPFPVIFHVHGGGWNGGTATEVPDAGLPPDSKLLCDQLGIVYVGLAYRCKDQNGTFALAMDDLNASIAWFNTNADRFRADLNRVGFSGGSAGTPLASVLAQQTPACKTYVGLFGVYNLLDNEKSLFPDTEARERYGLVTEKQQREASAFHQLRAIPPASLLFHGGKDILTHPSQSAAFAKKIHDSGGEAVSIVFPNVNHGYFNARYPTEFKVTCLKIARLYSSKFHLTDVDWTALDSQIRQTSKRFIPLENVDPTQYIGTWKGKTEAFDFGPEGTGSITNRAGKQRPFQYQVQTKSMLVDDGNHVDEFFIQQDTRAIFRIVNEGRHAGKHEVYNRNNEQSKR